MTTKKIGKNVVMCIAQDVNHTLLFNNRSAFAIMIRSCDVGKIQEVQIINAVEDDKTNE